VAELSARLTALQSELEASRMERELLDQEAVAAHREQVEGHASLLRRRKGDVDDGAESGADGARR
jgi:hypothetical protein